MWQEDMKMTKNNISKKKIFDLKLFKEGFRQLSVFGIISLILFIIESILVIVNNHEFTGTSAVMLLDIHPIAFFSFLVVAPIMTLYLFRFLASKSGSDFYHSLPHTRTCILVSFTAAIISWIFIILYGSSIAAISMHACFPEKYNINYNESFMVMTGIFIASILVICATVLAQCITGTMLTNIIVTGIILFFPCIMLLTFKYSVMAKSGYIVPEQHFLAILSGTKNLVTAPITVFLSSTSTYEEFTQNYTNPTSFIYTLFVAILLFGFAIFFYNRRKSEIAGNPAPNKYIQALYRICTTLIFCAIPIIMVSYDSTGSTELFTMYTIIAIAYFLFEIITTKTVKRVVKIIPGLLIIALLNIGSLAAINITTNNILSFKPEVEDIEYVRILSSSNSTEYKNSGVVHRYTSLLKQEMQIEDEFLFKYISSSLKEKALIAYDNITMEIHTKDGKTHYRVLSNNDKINGTIDKYAATDDNILKCIQTLPDYNSISLELFEDNMYLTDVNRAEFKKLYLSLQNEYSKLTDEEKFDIINFNIKNDYSVLFELTFRFKGQYTNISIPLTNQFPKTLKKYIDIRYPDTDFTDDTLYKTEKSILENVNAYAAASKTDYLEISVYSSDDYIYTCFYNDGTEYSDSVCDLYNRLSKYIPKDKNSLYDTLMSDTGYIVINIDDTLTTKTCTIPINEETDEIFSLLKMEEEKND